MKLQKITLLLLFLLIALRLNASQRIIYVDNFSDILGTYHLEIELLEFAKKHNINTLILYDLHKINKRFPLGDASKNDVLARFISKSKTEYNIEKVSASGESGHFFINAIHAYNLSREKNTEKFDVYNLEYEYWDKKASLENGYYCENYLKNKYEKCNRENSFKFFIESLSIMRKLADENSNSVKVEAYIGKFTETEVNDISNHVDQLLIHAYVKNPKESFHYVKNRLDLLSKIDSKIHISILFSSEMNFMGKWFQKESFHSAEQTFFKELERDEIKLEEKLNFKGFTYYNYSYFKNSLKFYNYNKK